MNIEASSGGSAPTMSCHCAVTQRAVVAIPWCHELRVHDYENALAPQSSDAKDKHQKRSFEALYVLRKAYTCVISNNSVLAKDNRVAAPALLPFPARSDAAQHYMTIRSLCASQHTPQHRSSSMR